MKFDKLRFALELFLPVIEEAAQQSVHNPQSLKNEVQLLTEVRDHLNAMIALAQQQT